MKNFPTLTRNSETKPKNQELNLDVALSLNRLDIASFAVLLVNKSCRYSHV